MHDLEQHVTLTEAAKRTPGRPSTNCLWCWCRKGVFSRQGERIRLQHVRIGGKIFTTIQWLEEFGQRVAEADEQYFDATDPRTLPRRLRQTNPSIQHRKQAIDQARSNLAAAGI